MDDQPPRHATPAGSAPRRAGSRYCAPRVLESFSRSIGWWPVVRLAWPMLRNNPACQRHRSLRERYRSPECRFRAFLRERHAPRACEVICGHPPADRPTRPVPDQRKPRVASLAVARDHPLAVLDSGLVEDPLARCHGCCVWARGIVEAWCRRTPRAVEQSSD